MSRHKDALQWVLFLGLGTLTQLAFKWGGTELEGLEFGQQWFDTMSRSPAVGIAIAGYIAMFVVWLVILQRTELSRAFSMTGLIYVTVPASAWAIFGEQIGWLRAAGIALIIVGVGIMGRDH
jgi:drug/metabolite transporter (DMT)-like permease